MVKDKKGAGGKFRAPSARPSVYLKKKKKKYKLLPDVKSTNTSEPTNTLCKGQLLGFRRNQGNSRLIQERGGSCVVTEPQGPHDSCFLRPQ